MATESVMGLFASPEQYQQQQYQQVLDRNIALAKLNPMQRGVAQLGTAAYQLGGAIGGALGAEDPVLQRQTQRRAFIQQVDMSDPKAIVQAIKDSSNDPELNAFLLGKYKEIETINKTQAETTKALREATPTAVREYKVAQSQGYTGSFMEYQTSLKKAGATNVSVDTKGDTAFAQERAKLQAKALSDAQTQAQSSEQALSNLSTMAKITAQNKVLSGPTANTAIGATQFLESVGMVSPETAKKLSNSEVYDKLAKDLVLQDLGGKLGGQISEGDRQFIEARIPQLKNSQQARTELINRLRLIHTRNVNRSKAIQTHANKYGNLNDFEDTSFKTTLLPEDKQALDWANANPNDPRAAAIKTRLGQ